MGSISNYTETAWLNHVLKVEAFTPPTSLYLALSSSDFTEDGTGGSEPSGNGYVRANCTSSFGAASSRIILNNSIIEFEKSTGSWGTLSYWAIFDASTGGNILCYGNLTSSFIISSDQTVRVLPGTLSISLTTGAISTYLANALLDHTFLDGSSYAVPANIYVGLASDNLSDDGSWTNEIANAGDYARILMNTWTVSTNNSSNTNIISFNSATDNWGNVTDHFLADSGSHNNGNMLFYGELLSPFVVLNGDTLSYNVNKFQITID